MLSRAAMAPAGRVTAASPGSSNQSSTELSRRMDSQTISSDSLATRADHSRFVQRIRRRYASDLASLPPGLPTGGVIAGLIEALRTAGRPLPQAMRVARQLVL